MKLTDDSGGALQLVRSYAPGELRIAEEVVRTSCLLSPERLIKDWRPQTVDDLRAEDLEAIFELRPEIVVLGSGTRQKFPEYSLLAQVMSRGIGCEVMDTGAACRTYNVLVSEDRRAVAALFVNDPP
jgi:uncharacterized protein